MNSTEDTNRTCHAGSEWLALVKTVIVYPWQCGCRILLGFATFSQCHNTVITPSHTMNSTEDTNTTCHAGSEWLALLKYAVVAVQGSAVAQSNLAWLLERSSGYDKQYRRQLCLRLLAQAGKSGLSEAWVDAGNLHYKDQQPGMLPFFLLVALCCLCFNSLVEYCSHEF